MNNQYPLDRAAGYLGRIPVIAARMRAATGERPADGSPLRRQVDEAGDAGSFILDGYSGAVGRLAVAEDHLAALGQLIADRQRVFPQYTVARTAAEVAARAWWFADPALTPQRRARRGFVDRHHSLSAQLSVASPDLRPGIQDRRRAVEQKATRAGVGSARGDRWPDASNLLRELWEDQHLGGSIYALLSSHGHGALFSIVYMLGRPADEGDGGDYLRRAQVQAPVEREAMLVTMALKPYLAAVTRMVDVCSWGWDELRSHLAYLSGEVSQILRGRR